MDVVGVQKERQIKWVMNMLHCISAISSSDTMVLDIIDMTDLLHRITYQNIKVLSPKAIFFGKRM